MGRFIVATISDIRCDEDYIEKLVNAGVSVVRLNTAHQSFEGSRKLIENLRAVSRKLGKKIEIMIDTKGPEIRTLGVKDALFVEAGELVQLVTEPENLSSKGFCVSYKKILEYAKERDLILIDDGELELQVSKKHDKYLECRAVNSGPIEDKKSVNVPGIYVDLPSLTEKDKEYIRFAIREKVDYIAHSFVRSRKDVDEILAVYAEFSGDIFPKIYAKIENQDGLRNIDEIIDSVYGILVARGDLANEIPLEELAWAQKFLVKKTKQANKPVIIATQMAYSMCWHPRPTRAELTDMANAILDGADGIMLSGETTHGKFPIEAVNIMKKIIERYQNGLNYVSSSINDFAKMEYELRV